MKEQTGIVQQATDSISLSTNTLQQLHLRRFKNLPRNFNIQQLLENCIPEGSVNFIICSCNYPLLFSLFGVSMGNTKADT